MTPRLIGLVGRAGAGKDTVGKILVNDLYGGLVSDWSLVAFATELKVICRDLFQFSDEQVWGSEKEVPDKRYPRPDGTWLTPREAMQVLGTEVGRRCYPNIWVEVALRQAAGYRSRGLNVAITDCRFVNEAKAVKAAGGQVWRVFRPEADRIPATHPSETELNTPAMGALVDRMIYNDGTLEELTERVKAALR